MEIKRAQYIIEGMQQDLGETVFNPKFSYENHNIRISTKDSTSLLSITNEKGTTKLQLKLKKFNNSLTIGFDSITKKYYFEFTYPIASDQIDITYIVDNTEHIATIYKGQTKLILNNPINITPEIVSLTPSEDIYYNYSNNIESTEQELEIKGNCLGYATINNYIVLFTHSDLDSLDRIYRIDNLQDGYLLFEGDLNFSLEYPIETLSDFESESVQKVYWIDSKNPIRFINIISPYDPNRWSSTTFDFSPEIEPYNFIKVAKNESGGEFAPGVIQYAFTYISDWHGVETNIVNTSSLNYISFKDRGGKEDETCYNSFSIKLSGLDPHFKYVRLYSIHRTSLDSTPTIKVLGEFEIDAPDYISKSGIASYISYNELKAKFKEVINSLNILEYSAASWETSLSKISNNFDSLMNRLLEEFEVNIGSFANGTFSLKEVFNYIWQNRSYYVNITDTGVIGTVEDPTVLLYKNSNNAIVSTFASKDSTLFVGGYKIQGAEDLESNTLKLFKQDKDSLVKIKVTMSEERHDTLFYFWATADKEVASDINIRITILNPETPFLLTIKKGTYSSVYEDGRYVGSTPEWTASIIKESSEQYYSDNYYTYYLEKFDSVPTSAILKGSNGYSEWKYRDYVEIENDNSIDTYTYRPYILNNSSNLCKQFKKGQPYRFALQGQFANGRWGDPILIETVINEKTLKITDDSDEIEEIESNEVKYTLDNICPLSFIVDPILDESGAPINLINDIYITNSGKSNLVYDRNGTVSPPDYFTKVSDTGRPVDTYFYIPSAAYNDSASIAKDTYKNSSFDWTKSAAPWKYIYNKDYFTSSLQHKDIPIENVSSYLAIKNNYTVNGKYSKSMWLGDMSKPQSTTELWDDSIGTFPGDFGKTEDIKNTEFKAGTTCLYLNKFCVIISNDKVKELYDKGYRKVRLLYVVPTKVNRKYPAQGILTNSIFIPKLRNTNSCWAYTDYLSRPREVYRVWNERTSFFTNWSTFIGDTRQYDGRASQITGSYIYTIQSRLIRNPYYFPFLHRFITNYGSVPGNETTSTNEWNKVWNIRPNYGHLMNTFREILGDYSNAEKLWYPESDVTKYFGPSYTKDEYNNSKSSDNGFAYASQYQVYKPNLTLETALDSKSNNYITFDDSIVDFWSPDIEYQESDKNYFENSIEGFQIRGLAGVISTSSSNFALGSKGNSYGTLGVSDSSNYHPFLDLSSIKSKGISSSTYEELTNRKDTTGIIRPTSYLSNPSIVDIAGGIHRLTLTGSGNWNIGAKGDCPWPYIWDSTKVNDDESGDNLEYFTSKIFSFRKYCLNTLMLKDLKLFRYSINTPTFFLKEDTIKPVQLYRTGITGESVLYNSGIDELLIYTNNNRTSIEKNVPIQYKANTHLTFSLAKGELITLNNKGEIPISNINSEYKSLPILPEFSAWAKFHENQKIIGAPTKTLYVIKLYWWPSRTSERPNTYINTDYSVTDSLVSGNGTWKVALECSTPLPIDITVNFDYKLGFWKSDKKSSKTGSSSITLKAGNQSTIKYFNEDWWTARDWSTINVISQSIKTENLASGWNASGKYIAYNLDSIILLMNGNTYLSSSELADENGDLISSDPWYLDGKSVYVEDMFDPIQGETLSSEYDNVGIDSIIYHRNLPYFLLVDLERSENYLYQDWQGSGIYNQIWIPCGESEILPDPSSKESCTIEATEGDVYVGRYDCLRVCSDSEKEQRVNDIVSFICESYTNPDGRSDINRYSTDTREVNFTNFNLLNPIYSQSNNYFTYNKGDYRILEKTGIFKNQFSWTLPKSPDSLVDQWTNLTFASTYNLNGEYGKLTKLVSHNNQIYAFQDKAIANILFNSRIQVPTSDGLPIELANSNKVDGIRYISTTSGGQNKWGIIITNSGIYYIDGFNKNLNLISSEGISDITARKGFTSWGLKNLSKSLDNLNLKDYKISNWILSKDLINKDLYIHDNDQCLVFSESLANFMSFIDYKNVPFIFNTSNNLVGITSTNNITSVYTLQTGEYNKYFEQDKSKSTIEYLINPDPIMDKVFNNIEFRADLFNADTNEYIPFKIFDNIEISNEFQYSDIRPLILYKNLQKKFRIWRAYLPRDSKEFKLNRIRNPWIKLKLIYTPEELKNTKLIMHDLIVNYTV